MIDFIQQHPKLFWSLMVFLGVVGVILLSMTIAPMYRNFLLAQREQQKREEALMGRYASLKDSVERASRGI